MTVRSSLGRARRATAYRRLFPSLLGRQANLPTVGYVGWTGEGNLGDEAMYAAHVASLGFGMRLVPIPMIGIDGLTKLLASRLDGICLGGGTLIGNGYFREGLQAVMAAAPQARRFMIGPGCESIDYFEGSRRTVRDEIRKWVPLLSEFSAVRVRGPQSVDALQSFGVQSQVTGDPALALPSLSRRGGNVQTIGLNVGIADDSWGGRAANPARLLSQLVHSVTAAGYRPRLVPTTVEDFHFLANWSSESGVACDLPARPLSLAGCLRWIADCDALVGMKLHAIVLAAGQNVPVYALEYRPKCRDFMESLNLGGDCVRVDHFDTEVLAPWLAVATTRKDDQSSGALFALRGRLNTAFIEEIDLFAQDSAG